MSNGVTELRDAIEETHLELEYLRFFYQEADFGPDHETVIVINDRYTGKIPEEYQIE